MRITVRLLLPAMLMVSILSGCAPTSTVILVSDPDGRTGKAEVSTRGGSRLLQNHRDMTRVSGSSSAPSPVTTADQAYISATFAGALAIEPPPMEKFILFFETGKTVLVPQSRTAIPDIMEAIKRRNAIRIAVSGHTDAAGSAQLNDRLAQERAEMVRNLLQQGGGAPERISVSSHGKGNPIVPTPDGVAEPRNRRVEVIVR